MKLARVIGNVTATVKHPILTGEKVLVVKPVTADGAAAGSALYALDRARAGIGDTVLVLDEGNSARQIMGDKSAPMRTVIVGILDQIEEWNRGR
jgi:ethanolamine utilization protein EutN